LIIHDSKDIYSDISNTCCSFKVSIHHMKNHVTLKTGVMMLKTVQLS